MNRPINLMIADDHQMVREGIVQLLELDNDIVVNGQAGDGYECLNIINKRETDILLLDINMPKMDGLEVLKYIKLNKSDLKVLMLTIHNEIEYLIKAVEIGVDGYVLKDSDFSILKKAIIDVYRGEKFIQPELTPLLNRKMAEKEELNSNLKDPLTDREMQVLKLITEGLYNKEIANILDISERTVKNHVSKIFKKINVTDRTQAAVYALRNNLVEL